jgi:ribulose-phosphate 3-epimerase
LVYKLAPSILSANFSILGEQVDEACQAGADYIHFDVMDGHFVPNITMGPLIVRSIKPITEKYNVPIDVHLMIEKPERMIPAFAENGADKITVHIETCPHVHRTIQHIRELGLSPGITMNPGTSLSLIDEILPYVDLVLVMTVNPGFGNQDYISTMTAKIEKLTQMIEHLPGSKPEIEVDGGIEPDNVDVVLRAGASVIVAGSAIFSPKSSITNNVNEFRARMDACERIV